MLNNPFSGNPTQRKAPAPPKFNPFANMPGWGTPPVNGIPQYGKANPNSTMPYLGGILKGTQQGVAPAPRGNPQAGILADYLNQMRADAGASSFADKGSMINAIRKYAISYGALPDFSQMGGLGGDAQGYFQEAMDPATQALAQKAEAEGVSSHARLSHANDVATRQIPSALAARGMLHSGQTGADLGEQAQLYKNQGYDMLNEMLSGITGQVGGYQNAERERQRQLADMEMQAAMQASQDWGDSYFDNPSAPATSQTSLASRFGLVKPQVTGPTKVRRRGGGFAKAM